MSKSDHQYRLHDESPRYQPRPRPRRTGTRAAIVRRALQEA